MFAAAVALVAGVLLFQQSTALPSALWGALLPPVVLCWLRVPALRLLWTPALGFLWALLHAHGVAPPPLHPDLEGNDLVLEGVVAGLPEVDDRRTRFLFEVERVTRAGVEYGSPGRVRLSWYRDAPKLRAGEGWRLTARLRRPRGLLNPHGFDYEGWLHRAGISATGYVRGASSNATVEGGPGLDGLRQSIRDGLAERVGESRGGAVLVALTVGDRSGLDDTAWDVFRRTGTSHLVAISGLHISIVAGIAFFAGRRLARLVPGLLTRLPADSAGAVAALACAAGYAALAGFALPTQRALLMLALVMGGRLLRRPLRPFRALAIALVLVVLHDPPSVLSAGLWLSFGAVTVILLAVAWRSEPAAWRAIGGVQWRLFVGLAPVLLAFQLDVSLSSPLVNLVAVPVFSFLLVPLALCSALAFTLFGEPAAPLLELAALAIDLACAALAWAAGLTPVVGPGMYVAPAAWLGLLTAAALLVMPRGLPGRWLGLLFLLPLLHSNTPSPEPGALDLTVLDVGQGMSVVVRTSGHALLYDAGPRTYGGFDAGRSVVLPYLRGEGLDRLDRVVLSNGDADHAGGLAAVLEGVSVGDVLSGEADRVDDARVRSCQAGERWRWDGVTFRVLHPPAGGGWAGNDASCVLRIDNGRHSLLLTGDIERAGERRLVADQGARLDSDLVVVPHHGSATSSSPPLVEAVRPVYAVVSAGHGNRYGFPRGKVLDRWRAVGAKVLNTAQTGAIRFTLSPSAGLAGPELARERLSRYWSAR